jgi:hypothetical protein
MREVKAMRKIDALRRAALLAVALGALCARAEEPFDACDIFTQADAEKVLGTTAAVDEPPHPAKWRKPKVTATCTYGGFKDGKKVAASVQFRFGKTDADTRDAFEDARLRFQTKPLLVGGTSAFWNARTGQLDLVKGRTWISVSVGTDKPAERDMDQARRLAEALATRI